MKSAFWGLVLGTWFVSCSSVGAPNIYGSIDPRTDFDPSELPAVGKVLVFTGNESKGTMSGTCTGTLLSPQWVLTARHCVSHLLKAQHINRKLASANGSEGQSPLKEDSTISVFFAPGLTARRKGSQAAFSLDMSAEKATAFDLNIDNPELSTQDWLLLRAEGSENFESLTGKITYPKISPDVFDGLTLMVAGYSQDYKSGLIPSVARRCHVRETLPDNLFKTDCSFSPGASGGGVFGMRINGIVVTKHNEDELLDLVGAADTDVSYFLVGVVQAMAPLNVLINPPTPAINWKKLLSRRSFSALPLDVIPAVELNVTHFKTYHPVYANFFNGAANFVEEAVMRLGSSVLE